MTITLRVILRALVLLVVALLTPTTRIAHDNDDPIPLELP